MILGEDMIHEEIRQHSHVILGSNIIIFQLNNRVEKLNKN